MNACDMANNNLMDARKPRKNKLIEGIQGNLQRGPMEWLWRKLLRRFGHLTRV